MSSKRSNAPNLQRGGACVNCRRRKMRCDGVHPVCGQCVRAERPDDCEYVVGQEPSRTQILEENISRLEARIQELQMHPNATQTVSLQQPYAQSVPHFRPSTVPVITSRPSLQEPPPEIIEKLLGCFLQCASEFGFFLNVPRFRSTVLLGRPLGHPSRPSPALLACFYLVGIHVSRDPSFLVYEESYLKRARQQVGLGLSGNHPHKVIHGIQAEVLLAHYFFANGRFNEGKYHISAAVSLAVVSGLHKIRSRQPFAPTPNTLPPPQDPTEEGERILAYWTVFSLDKSWAAALNSPSNITYPSEKAEARLDAPWPLETEEYEQGRFPSNARTEHTLQKFMSGTPSSDVGLSSKAVLAKAAFLWERVDDLIQTWHPSLSPPEFNTFSTSFANLDTIIDRLKHSAIPLNQLHSITNIEQIRNLIVGYSILQAATIRLHDVFAQGSGSSKRKRLSAAQAVIDIARTAQSLNLLYLNAVLGWVWIDASQIIVNEVYALRTQRSRNEPPSDMETSLIRGLHRGLAAMQAYSSGSSLMNFQVLKIKETYDAL